jgi:hypothetical protein
MVGPVHQVIKPPKRQERNAKLKRTSIVLRSWEETMNLFPNCGIGRQVRKVGANAVTFLLALVVPPQAANAVLYLTADAASPEVGLWRHLRLLISSHGWHSSQISRNSKKS